LEEELTEDSIVLDDWFQVLVIVEERSIAIKSFEGRRIRFLSRWK